MAVHRFTRSKLVILACAMLGFVMLPLAGAQAGDTIFGTVTAVKNATDMTLDYGGGRYAIHIVGIDVADKLAKPKAARAFVAKLVLGKRVRLKFYDREPNGVMTGRLLTDDRAIAIQDVGLELVRAGLVRRQENFDYMYGELSSAEREAQGAHRGLWSTARPK